MRPDARLAEIKERLSGRNCLCWECEAMKFLLEYIEEKRVIWDSTEAEYQENLALGRISA